MKVCHPKSTGEQGETREVGMIGELINVRALSWDARFPSKDHERWCKNSARSMEKVMVERGLKGLCKVGALE